MKTKRTRFEIAAAFSLLAVVACGALPFVPEPDAAPLEAVTQDSLPTVILVHGAFADGSSWQELIQILQNDGYPVVAVQNPLTSLVEDVASTRRVLNAHDGPIVMVGHSYGGAVMTAAAVGYANVKALVYVAAFAPDAGEPLGALLDSYPSDLGKALVPDEAGFATIAPDAYHEVFAGDLPRKLTRAMAAAQRPTSAGLFAESTPEAAWRSLPTWYLVAQEDHTINPDLQRFYASRMGASTLEIRTSHLPFISRPNRVAEVIDQAVEQAF